MLLTCFLIKAVDETPADSLVSNQTITEELTQWLARRRSVFDGKFSRVV